MNLTRDRICVTLLDAKSLTKKIYLQSAFVKSAAIKDHRPPFSLHPLILITTERVVSTPTLNRLNRLQRTAAGDFRANEGPKN